VPALSLNFPQNLIDPPGGYNVVKKSFGHLRRFAMVHMRVDSYEAHESGRRQQDLHQARQELLEFAKMAEKVQCAHKIVHVA